MTDQDASAYWAQRNADYESRIAELLAEVAALKRHAQCAWRLIETAPRDRSRILLWQSGRGAFEGWWHDGWPSLESYWMDDADSEPEPTHWQPMLPNPALTSTDGSGK